MYPRIKLDIINPLTLIISLYSHFHPEAVGHIDGHRSSVAMGTHSVRISDVV